MSVLFQESNITMEFACGFVYVPPLLIQKDCQRLNVNAIKRSGGIFQTLPHMPLKKKI